MLTPRSASTLLRPHQAVVYATLWMLTLCGTIAVQWPEGVYGWGDEVQQLVAHVWIELLPFWLLFVMADAVLRRLLALDRHLSRLKGVCLLAGAIALFVVAQLLTLRLGPNAPLSSSSPSDYSTMRQAVALPDMVLNIDNEGSHFTTTRAIYPTATLSALPHDYLRVGDLLIAPLAVRTAVGVVMVLLTFMAHLFLRNVAIDKRLNQIAQSNLERELTYLRHQLNPHFFMNTLNNIHTLIEFDAERAQKSLLHLSQLMRYVLYESNTTFVPLTKELDFLRHYMAIMRLRYTHDIHLTLSLPTQQIEGHIPPMLLINFVENAFKHGISTDALSYVTISIDTTEEHLHFACTNSIHAVAPEALHTSSGIGVANTLKRLDLLYGSAYTYTGQATDAHTYHVALLLPLQPPSSSHSPLL